MNICIKTSSHQLLLRFLILLVCFPLQAQNIKTIQLRPLNSQQFLAVVPLGGSLELSFDDLDGDSKEYQYKIEHMTYDWKLSNLIPNQYINGFEQDYITNVTNSFNTLQSYTHYAVRLPNQNTIITKSGNYLISVLNEDDEVVFSRKCVFYEPLTTVGVAVFRSANVERLNEAQTVQFIINYTDFTINNPAQEINVVLFQNNNWNASVKGLKPHFYKPNQLLYNYTNKTTFWGGNEFRNFDNKRIRNTNINIAKVERKELFNTYLYLDKPRADLPYSYNPDINGQFIVRTLDGEKANTEADYTMIHFYLDAFEPYKNKDVYVYGAFNNFELTSKNKMLYNEQDRVYTSSILLKQGFYNYKYVTLDKKGFINTNEIAGSFYETENIYTVIVYYRPFGSIYDRVIGVGNGAIKP